MREKGKRSFCGCFLEFLRATFALTKLMLWCLLWYQFDQGFCAYVSYSFDQGLGEVVSAYFGTQKGRRQRHGILAPWALPKARNDASPQPLRATAGRRFSLIVPVVRGTAESIRRKSTGACKHEVVVVVELVLKCRCVVSNGIHNYVHVTC